MFTVVSAHEVALDIDLKSIKLMQGPEIPWKGVESARATEPKTALIFWCCRHQFGAHADTLIEGTCMIVPMP